MTDATHSSFTVVQDPNAKPEKMPFKEQVRFRISRVNPPIDRSDTLLLFDSQVKGYAKMYAGKAFGNMDEVALGKAKLADQLPDKS
jgi:hypothetical protein